MRARGPLGGAIVSVVLVGALWAQASDLARVRTEFGEAEAARIEAVIDASERDGLPRALLVDKAVEGAAKRMEPGVVLAAVRMLAEELRAAARVVGRDAGPTKLEKTADALRHGVDPGLLAELNERNPRDFAVLIVAIEDLLHAGVTLAVAEDLTRDATRRGLAADEMLALPAAVRRLVREGRTPQQAASSVQQSLRAGQRVVPPPPAEGPSSFPTRSARRIPPPS